MRKEIVVQNFNREFTFEICVSFLALNSSSKFGDIPFFATGGEFHQSRKIISTTRLCDVSPLLLCNATLPHSTYTIYRLKLS